MQERSTYVDIAKGIAIIAVVLLHVNYVFPENRLFFTSKLLGWAWHVPVFFLLGGFFLKEEKLLKPWPFIRGKIRSLYLLALYIYLPATLLHNLFLSIGWYQPEIDYGGKHVQLWDTKEYIVGVVKTVLCAGREPLMGAMWFVYVLLFGLCGYSLLSWCLKNLTNTEKQYEGSRLVAVLVLQIVSCIATNVFGFTIPRFSNAISVMLLLWVGQQMNNRWKLEFNNGWICVACALIVYQCSVLLENGGYIGLNHNDFRDVLQLTVGSASALYVVCYFSKRLDRSLVGKWIGKCGKESFYIMGLHIIGFRICTLILITLGVVDGGLAELMTPRLDSLMLLFVYTLAGVILPVFGICLFRIGIRKLRK